MTPDNDLEKVAREIVKDTYLHNVGGNLSSSSAMMRRINLELRIFLALDAERLAERERCARMATDFIDKKPTLEQLDFIINRQSIGAKVEIKPDGTVLMSDSAVCLLIAEAIRKQGENKKEQSDV